MFSLYTLILQSSHHPQQKSWSAVTWVQFIHGLHRCHWEDNEGGGYRALESIISKLQRIVPSPVPSIRPQEVKEITWAVS